MKTSQVNGDDTGSHALNGGTQAPASRSESASSTTVAAPAQQPEKARHEPAFTPPQDNPAVPRDEHHGKGGMYALVDGKRVPADNDGNPLPKSKK